MTKTNSLVLPPTPPRMRSFPEASQGAVDAASEHRVGWAEVDGQMSGLRDLLSRDDCTAIDAGLPGRV